MVKRNLDIKKRGAVSRCRKSVYLIVTEGKNKTETNYFFNFQEQGKNFNIHFVKAGNNTDAESLYKTILSKWREYRLSEASGDRAFVVVDIDNDPAKADKLNQLIKENKNDSIYFIVSNPTFEVWFLLHFTYTTKYFANGDAVIKELKKHIPGYEKNKDYYADCFPLQKDALKNCERLEAHYEGMKWPSEKCNPRTDIGKMVRELM